MNKFGKISLITAGVLGLLAGGGAVLHYTGVGNNKPDTSIVVKPSDDFGKIDINKTYTSAQYLSMINQYTKQIDGLKVELANSQEKYNQAILDYQTEISSLQQEIENMGKDNTDLLAEKNARIDTLKAYIKTMENEHSEQNKEYEKQITELNSLLANYESKVLQTIKLPSDFIFTSLGFKVIENNDFIFYSTSHSCKLYYYHFETETLETIAIKGTQFDSFYKLNNVLYFRTSKMLYRYDFHTQEINILGSANGNLSFTADTNNLYVFDYYGGYGVLNFDTMKFENYLLSTEAVGVDLLKLDNYILHWAYSSTPSNSNRHYNIRCYDTETQTDKVLLEDNTRSLNSFIKTNNGYFMCVGNGFYKLNILTMNLELIKDLGSSYNSCYLMDGKIVVFSNTEAFVYNDSTLTSIASYAESNVRPIFYKLSNGVYYVVSNSSVFKGIWKLDLTNNTLTQLSSSCYTFYSSADICNYKFIGMQNGIYVVDMNTGTIDILSTNSSSYSYTLKTLNCGNFDILYCSYNSSNGPSTYVYFYDKVNDLYGKIYNGCSFSLKECEYKNGILYVMTESTLYSFNLDANLNNYVNNLSIDGALSNLNIGVFYANVGTLDGSKLYIKYTLQDDGTFTKDLVII